MMAMFCLYASDYGPPDPSFDPFAGNGQSLKGFEGHVYQLATAQNRGQLEAMKRKLTQGEEIAWCDQGYGWTYAPYPAQFFELVVAGLILPWLVLRVFPLARAWSRPGRGRSTPEFRERS
jgi:hypothetical protein